ncbi:MAG: hypothetical protein HN909_08695 [Phycisphaerales bacterium]|jgi:hypothetical protein|nr:hypothetical protein [Phycisphaerales bacterium]MBT7171831.1 hypothetical protein [Phycisphaerales bacterium]
MRRRKQIGLLASLTLVGLLWAGQGDDPRTTPDAPATPPPATLPSSPAKAPPLAAQPPAKAGVIQLRGVEIDRTKGEIRFDVQSANPDYLLEFLLCQGAEKGYESGFTTKTLGQDIHAGLLVLGLHRGIYARRMDGEDIPPKGCELDVLLEWVAKDKSVKRMNVLDALKVDAKVRPTYWVFVGSEISPRGGYAADQNGSLISVSNLPTAVIDLPVVSSRSMEARMFSLDGKKLPAGVKTMRMVIRPRKNAAKSPYARATLDIAADGGLRIDGKAISFNELEKWAAKFTDRFPGALVEIRTHSRAMACLMPLAALEMKLGGVFDTEQIILPPDGPIFGRTVRELSSRLSAFAAKYANPEEEFDPPANQARVELAEIDRQLRELERVKALWIQYRAKLEAMAKAAPKAKKDSGAVE